jgi:hypothetical protein
MTKAMGFIIMFAALAATTMAEQLCDTPHGSVPEIDANLGGSALALISGAMLIVRGRRKQ